MLTRSPEKALPQSEPALPFVGLDAIPANSMQVAETVSLGSMKSAGSRFRTGDVLYGRLRPYLNKVWHADREGACSGELLVLRANGEIDPRFLAYRLHGREFVDYASHAVTGDRPRLDFKQLAAFRTALPPLESQRRIVARIDELFSEVDDGEEELRRARADLETYRKSLLKAAVTGELTADWRAANPPKETGADLLQRILTDRRTRWQADSKNKGKRYSEPARRRLSNLPALPESWTWVSIEQLTTSSARNGLSMKESPVPTEVRGLRLDALQPRGIDWTRARYLPVSLDRARPYLLRRGDLLISRANGSPALVGKCSLVTDGRDDTIFPDTAIRYPLWGRAPLPAFIQMAWSAPQSRSWMLSLAKTTAGILKVSQSDIAAVPLPLPPHDEIIEIMARLERLSDETESGSDDLTYLGRESTTLRQSILAAAFRGELVQ